MKEKPVTETQKFKAMYAKMEATKPKTPNPFIAMVAVLLIGVVGVAVISAIRPDVDVLVISAVIFGFLTPTTASLLSYLKAQEAQAQAQETHLAVNSRLDEFIKNASLAANAAGRKEGREASEARTDELTRQASANTGLNE